MWGIKKAVLLEQPVLKVCDPAGTRTQGPNIKSVVLYQLSYEINLFPSPFGFGSAKIRVDGFDAKTFLGYFQHFFRCKWIIVIV